MQLVLNDDQQMLAQTAREFAAEHCTVERLRKLRDSEDELGYSKRVWNQMAELGWLGIPFKDADGGLDLGLAEVIIVSEALGRGLTPEPYVPAVMLAGQALSLGGSAEQRARWLTPLIEGDKVLALAYSEPDSRFDPHRIELRAERTNAGFVLRGDKADVMGGFGADALVVAARTSGETGDSKGITLFLVPADAPGVEIERQWRIDSRNAALVKLDGVSVPESDVVGGVDQGGALLADVVDRATVALSAEMLGGMSEAFDRTLAYLKERVQFGVAIGSFQALKHRAARIFIDIELARSAVMAAARAIDEGDDARLLVSTCKARCSDAYTHIANEALQLHGGIGMTDEHDVGFFMKHARVAEMTFGDAGYHRDRFARAYGF